MFGLVVMEGLTLSGHLSNINEIAHMGTYDTPLGIGRNGSYFVIKIFKVHRAFAQCDFWD